MIMDLVLHILSWLAEEEWNDIKQAQAEGIVAARKKGKHLGRPAMNLATLTTRQHEILQTNYAKWKSGEITGVELMKKLNLKKNTFYKIINE
ncbi:hypothetical protein SK066_14750 [Paenibacillus hunanensis]|uniref:hypothetical protein n=1 Tax=Paenibacillus hunanensis TaxID=539262 RepID=UPI002A6B6F7B|nr:hypothetical protein [Paenibacillus hunanensis]WPP39875.1 hypothetical protein SK066_14750 [Paenibacillus hunanensis]